MAAGHWIPEMVKLAGGQDGLGKPGEDSARITWDDVLRCDPEVILVMPCSFSMARTAKEFSLLATRPRWNTVSAVKAKRVYAINTAFFHRQGPRLIRACRLWPPSSTLRRFPSRRPPSLDVCSNVMHPIYQLICSRRDVRRFVPRPIAANVLKRILDAAHHAPSVGFMQPWNFILIRDPHVKARIKQLFLVENTRAARRFRGRRRQLYDRLKLEGIEEAPVNICVTCDTRRLGPHVLGRNTIRRTDIYSTCCAIQNLWLAARAEGVGVGWVSILKNDRLKSILGIPAGIIPVAYLCVGYPVEFLKQPELELVG
jgi:5,6-dimethylbenzimidazole synthase